MNEENYCVNNYRDVKLSDDDLNNLEFGNDCKVRSNYFGDGFSYNLKYVKKILYSRDDNTIRVLLKGSKREYVGYDQVLWENEKTGVRMIEGCQR
jgi:hypothetical protein